MPRYDEAWEGRRRRGRGFERRFERELHKREAVYRGPYGADYEREDFEPVEQRPYEYGRGARAWPQTGRGLSAGGRQGPGRAWGMGGHPELASESDRYAGADFGELHTSGMGIVHGPDWRWAEGARERGRGESGWPYRTVGVGPVRARGGRGLPPTYPGAEDWGHPEEIPGSRYLSERVFRARPRGRAGREHGPGDVAAASYGDELRVGREGGRPDARAAGGRAPLRPGFDETKGGAGYGVGYTRGRRRR